MTDSVDQRRASEPGDPEAEWDVVVRRISERLKRRTQGSSGGSGTTQSGLDLASELVRLERRALEAEASLVQERDTHAVRVKEMEEKLRKLEPWLRQLKTAYQQAGAERDALREELTRAPKGGRDPAAMAALVAKASTLERELVAARAARDEAVAGVEASKRRLKSATTAQDSAWKERVDAAEAARDQALEDLKQMKRAAGENRRAEDEIRRQLKNIEQLEKTTSAHKAVARAAQEEAAALQTRVADLEKTGVTAAQMLAQAVRRAEDLNAQLDQAQGELASARQKFAEAESAAPAARVAEETLLRDLNEKIEALAAAREALAQSQRSVDELRAESSQAQTLAAAALAAAQADVVAARKEAAEAKDLADEAMRAETEARARVDALSESLSAAEQAAAAACTAAGDADAKSRDLAELLAAETRAREDAERRAQDLTLRVEAGSSVAQQQVALEAEAQRERDRAGAAEQALRELQERHDGTVIAQRAELDRVRDAAVSFVSTKARELVEGARSAVDGPAPARATEDETVGIESPPADAAAAAPSVVDATAPIRPTIAFDARTTTLPANIAGMRRKRR